MEILTAHRDRIAQLRETLERLIGQHRRLFELRSESWHEQQEGDPDRDEMLRALHRQIDEAEAEAERLHLHLLPPREAAPPAPREAERSGESGAPGS